MVEEAVLLGGQKKAWSEVMHCLTCQKAMAAISNDTGIGVVIRSFYCRRCNVSYTDRESVEAVVERMKSPGKLWSVSQLQFRGVAS